MFKCRKYHCVSFLGLVCKNICKKLRTALGIFIILFMHRFAVGVADLLSALLVTGGLCQKKGGRLAQEGFRKLTGMQNFINVDFMYVSSID